MKSYFSLTLIASLFLSFHIQSQSITGFWQVDKVTVGDRNLTPVARWFKIKEDGTYIGGNGWTQNSYGTWEVDLKSKQITVQNNNGILDEFGPFTFKPEGDKMTWEREEDGMKVIVSKSRITEMPMSPQDKMQGMWDLISVKENNADITKQHDPDNRQFIWIRPDRLYRIRSADNSEAEGYWWMNGHHPELVLLNYDKSVEDLRFDVSFENENLVMKERKENGLQFIYERIQFFPQ